MVAIFSLNVLSDDLAISPWYPKTDERWLDPSHRINKLKQILLEYAEQKYIFCLQEVSIKWNVLLTTFFNSLHYTVKYVPFESRLGVAICFPNEIYREQTTHSIRIGQQVCDCISDSSIPDIYEAKIENNWLLVVELQQLETNIPNLFIATYHMPCKFMKKSIMEIHTFFCIKTINEIVGDFPVVFAGDFNSKFGESEWAMLTKGQFTSPVSQMLVRRFPIGGIPFHDAAQHETVTCINQVTNQMLHIDFVLYRHLVLQYSGMAQPPSLQIPSKEYPSDHLYLFAVFSFT